MAKCLREGCCSAAAVVHVEFLEESEFEGEDVAVVGLGELEVAQREGNVSQLEHGLVDGAVGPAQLRCELVVVLQMQQQLHFVLQKHLFAIAQVIQELQHVYVLLPRSLQVPELVSAEPVFFP